MAEEIKQLQALLTEYDSDENGDEILMEEGALEFESEPDESTHKASTAVASDQKQDRTVKLKYGSLIKTIEASSRASSTTNATSSNNNNISTRTNNNAGGSGDQTFCKNCLRLMFTVFYLIYSKGWIIINTTFIFIVIFIFYSIKS